MAKSISISDYLNRTDQPLLIDVRSPGEYEKAHIPGAVSLPLFTDEERKVVGTAYKQESREKAIKIGLKYFGPKMVKMIEQVEKWMKERNAPAEFSVADNGASTHQPQDQHGLEPVFPGKRPALVVHCWRGGMRSAGVAWLLDLYGFEVYTIRGGYKAWRHWCLQQFTHPWPLQIVGGNTGSGKTEILQHLKGLGQPVIDLEGLACHKGSAFGNINMPPQPGQEMFENQLAIALHKLRHAENIWLEDESQRIGDINIPMPFFSQMRNAPLYLLNINFEARLDNIVKDYGRGDLEKLVNAIIRIQKRLGGLEAKNAIQFLMDADIRSAFSILLRYYDKWYTKGLGQHRPNLDNLVVEVALPGADAGANANTLLGIFRRQKAENPA